MSIDHIKALKNEFETNTARMEELRNTILELDNRNTTIEREIAQIEKNMVVETVSLNEQQQIAVDSVITNSIIIACPGSGKTHTLIAKVCNLVRNHQVDPKRIILITFTKKAAQEMSERLRKSLGSMYLMHIGTIHSLAYRSLQKFKRINYTILDEREAHTALRKILQELMNKDEIKYDQDDSSLLHKKITMIYSDLTTMYPITKEALITKMNLTKHMNIILNTLEEYEVFKTINRYMDFDNLMINFLSFLESDESEIFRSHYDYIMFDEYQDVNSIQNVILMELNKECQNLTVVGDDAQSIYAFRGSEVKYIINFNKDVENVQTHHLELNYRSTPEIINFCNAIIASNNNQIDKTMVSTKESSGIKPKVTGFRFNTDEVNYVVRKIKTNLKAGIKLKDQVIIARTNRQLDQFELDLIRNGIYYQKTKGFGILDRIHVKNFLAFLIILINPKSIIHWKRILSLQEGIGDKTAAKIVKRTDNPIDVIMTPQSYFDEDISARLATLSDLVQCITELHKEKKTNQLCAKIIEYLKPQISEKTKTKEQQSYNKKLDDLECLKSYASEANSILDFLVDIHLTIDIDEEDRFQEDDADCLLLSTIHGSKGLEWEVVFLCGCSSDLMPSLRESYYNDELDAVEEERRLFYVGCSRAKKYLELTLSYDYHGTRSDGIYVTPFLTNIPNNLYISDGIVHAKRLGSGNTTHIISNYLTLKTSSKVYPYLKTIECTYKSWYTGMVDPCIYNSRAEVIYGVFIDNLITKMVYQKFTKYVTQINVPIYDKYNIPKDTAYHEFIDPNNDWRDLIVSILRVSIKRQQLPVVFADLHHMFKDIKHMVLYELIDDMMTAIVEESLDLCQDKDKMLETLINLHFNIGYGDIMGEADMVVGRTLVEFKASRTCIATTKYVLQTILYRYMLRKKGVRIDRIILVNPILGETYTLQITPHWKDTFKVYREVLGLPLLSETDG